MVDPAVPMNQRYTHYYEDAGAGRPKLTQLDYIFVSEALRRRITGYDFESRGIHGIDAVAGEKAPSLSPHFPLSLAGSVSIRSSGVVGGSRSVEEMFAGLRAPHLRLNRGVL